MEVVVLASGSSGNAVLVRSETGTVLVDAGISCLQIVKRLAAFDVSPDEIDAVLITHEHSDHIRGLEVFTRKHQLPVWATAGTWRRLDVRTDGGGEVVSGKTITFNGLTVLPVETCHDAAEPVAYMIEDSEHRAAVCTDTGVFSNLLAHRLSAVDLLLIETNHDSDMLRHGPYPWPLKQRIASRLGHLANHQAADAVQSLVTPELRCAVGMHLSAENNAASLAEDSLRRSVPPAVSVTSVSRHEMLRISPQGGGAVLDKRPIPPSRRKAEP